MKNLGFDETLKCFVFIKDVFERFYPKTKHGHNWGCFFLNLL